MKKTVIITGASDGIGAAAARQLAAQGEHVVLVGRTAAKTAAIARELDAPFHLADFTDLAQVRRLADELLDAYPRIDVLANNAGGLFKKARTTDGFDKTFQVNYLCEFLLTNLLLERLIASHAAVIQTSSIGARIFGHIELDKFTDRTPKSPMRAYGNTKLANILFTKELHRRYHHLGLSAVAFHPGNIASNFAHDYGFARTLYHSWIGKRLLDTPEDGGRALSWLVNGTPGRTWLSGEYYEHNELAPPGKVNPQARDVKLAKALWQRSLVLSGLPESEPTSLGQQSADDIG